MSDAQSIDAQLTEWVAGNPIHNTLRDECCPDFSCCEPELMWPEETRKEFEVAGEDKRSQMLSMALGAALAHAGKRDAVHVVGMDGGDDE